MAKKKLIQCKACDAEIARSAKVCPHCGAKNKKPFYKKAWFWILAVIILFAAAGGGGEESTQDTTPSSGDTHIAQQQNPEKPEEKTAYQVGDVLEENQLRIVYVSSGEYKDYGQYSQPAEGNKYIFLKFAFENLSSTSDQSVSFYSFECYADGYNAEMEYFADEELSATLSAGRATEGYLYFQVPADAQEIEVEYTKNVLTEEKIKFLYEGEQDSGYVLEANAAPTPGAIQAGGTAESSQLKISYLSCYVDTSNNQYFPPKDGYHYVTCEFEFENVSSSDQSVTFYSFDCYADGINCDGAYFRDDGLSATLSAGRKAKGTVTFEVPIDAAVVEVEYLSNFWTSNRVVFNAGV